MRLATLHSWTVQHQTHSWPGTNKCPHRSPVSNGWPAKIEKEKRLETLLEICYV